MEFCKRFLIRVFSGGEGGAVHLQMAVAKMICTIKGAAKYLLVEYASNKNVRENPEVFGTPSLLFNWLTKGDVYLIPSQGIWMGIIHCKGASESGWNVAGIAEMLQQLASSSNIGFPFQKQLTDPMWTGDKIGYIFLLQNLAIPTLMVDLTSILDKDQFEKVGRKVYEFQAALTIYGGTETVNDRPLFMKAPYTQNGLHYRGQSYSSFVPVMEEIARAVQNNVKAVFPYLILQPYLVSREWKVIMRAGKPEYFHKRGKNSQNPTPPHSSDEAQTLFAFAKLVHSTLAIRCPHAILDGLVRIDIMKLPNGSLVVNEVEGVDANYASTNMISQGETALFLEKYWYEVIENCVKSRICVA